jgi:acyl carrier protein
MNHLEEQLSRCFAAIFPDLPEAEIRNASMEKVSGWDSIATINLVGVIEEEFQIDIDPADVEEIASFESAASLLRARSSTMS